MNLKARSIALVCRAFLSTGHPLECEDIRIAARCRCAGACAT
jgi:hypothetical protein